MTLKWLDLFVMGLFFIAFIGIGAYFGRKNRSAEDYFLAGRNLPGWLVGCSVMATVVSALTFLATPGFAYKEDWRYIPWNLGYVFTLPLALILFMPLFRRTGVQSAYEYLERRFGTWARLYSGGLFVIWTVCRMSIILYATCLPIPTIMGIDLLTSIVVIGVVGTTYTVAGGLSAVIWTDLLQMIAMYVGAIICLPILVAQLPGGFNQIFSEAYTDGKMSLGSTAFTFDEKTIWVMTVLSVFTWMHWGCQDQSTIQRYCAPKSEKEAKKSLWLGVILSIPIWFYFTFLGTSLYVFYKVRPDPLLNEVVAKPEQILPFFVWRNVPAGLAGLFLCGVVSAALSTIVAGINAVASTLTVDFYRRLFVREREEYHYMVVGRYISCMLGALMTAGAVLVHYTNTDTLNDLQTLVQSVSGGGLLALTLLGMLTVRVDNRAAIIAVSAGFLMVCGWLILDSGPGQIWFPEIVAKFPDKFWIHVFVNLFVFALGYALSFWFRNLETDSVNDLTIWTYQAPDK